MSRWPTRVVPLSTMDLECNRSDVVFDLRHDIFAIRESFDSPMMDIGELAYASAALVASDPRDGDVIVEIGTFEGLTACFLAKVLDALGVRACVLSIDPFERFEGGDNNPPGSYAGYIANLQTHGAERCFPLVAFSHECVDAVAGNVPFLLIDGDHSYEACLGDLELYCPKVRSGGYVLIDDYSHKHYPGVAQAVDEYFGAATDFELLHLAWFAIARRRVG